MKLKQILAQILTLAFTISLAANVFAADIPDPETFFGHKPGADFKLIRWEKIVEYYQLLGRESNRIHTYALPEGASGLAYDGTWLYCGIYGPNGSEVYRIDPDTGAVAFLFNGPKQDSVVTVSQALVLPKR